MVWPAALESPRVTLCMTQPPSIAAHRIATAQRLSHLDLFITTASTAVRAPVLIGSASAWRLQDREFDQAHAAVVGILPFDKRCLLQPIDRDADRSRREPYFGTDRIDRQWSLVEQRFEHTEIRVAEACPAQVQALLRVSRQGAKRLPEHQPDMNPG